MDKQKILEALDVIATEVMFEGGIPQEAANGNTISQDKSLIPASDKQLKFMKTLKIGIPPNCTMAQASALISAKTGK